MTRRLLVEADGGSRGNPGPAGYGAVVRDADTGQVLAERAAAIGTATNNVAEYGGLIAGLQAAIELKPDAVEVRMDSKLVVEQMSGRWQVKHPAMRPLAREAAALVAQLPTVRFTWVPRERNKHADKLANAAMDAAAQGATWAPDEADAWLQAQPDGAGEARPVPVANRLSGWSEGSAPPLTTLLLRHGRTQLSVDKRFSGIGNPPLTEAGRAEAAAAAARLGRSGATAVVSSPLDRARQTGLLVAHALGVQMEVDEELRETDFGDWEGYTLGEVRERWPRELEEWLADTSVAPPFGESFDETERRVAAALERLKSSYDGATVVVVSHVTPIKTLLRLALGAPPSAYFRMHLDIASLCEVQWFSDAPSVVRSLNDTAHLRA